MGVGEGAVSRNRHRTEIGGRRWWTRRRNEGLGTIAEGEESTLTVAIANGVTFADAQTMALATSGTASASDYTLTPASLTLGAVHGGKAIGTATLTITDTDGGATPGAAGAGCYSHTHNRESQRPKTSPPATFIARLHTGLASCHDDAVTPFQACAWGRPPRLPPGRGGDPFREPPLRR